MRACMQTASHAALAAVAVAFIPVFLTGPGGCARSRPALEPQPGPVRDLPPAQADTRAEQVRRDPLAYLRRVHENTRKLTQYRLLFIRQERRGFFPRLHAPEHIDTLFRRQPFSVRMEWLDEDSKYGKSTYVAGQYDNKVRFVTRTWSPPLLPPPSVNRVDVQTPVAFGEAKRPVTDFGLEAMMERTLTTLKDAGEDVVLSYVGLTQLPGDERTVHHLRLEYNPEKFKVPTQELFIDVLTDLPAGTILRLPSGDADGAYYYRQLERAVRLTDADFILPEEREASRRPATSQPGAAKN